MQQPPKAPPPLPNPEYLAKDVQLADGRLRAVNTVTAGTSIVRSVPMYTLDFKAAQNGSFADNLKPATAELQKRAAAARPRIDSDPQLQCLVFGGEDGSDGMVAALLPVLSTVGHSISPNCTLSIPWALRPNERVIVSLVALTDISPGTELTISHVNRLQDPARRAARLAWQYGDRMPAGAELPASMLQALTAVKDGAGTAAGAAGVGTTEDASPQLVQLSDAVPGSSTISPGNAVASYQACKAFLDRAAPVLADTHWRVVRARRSAIVGLMYQQKWAEAWAELRTQARAVFSMLSPADSEAQYHTHALGEHILRGWQSVDKASAGAASVGAMVRYSHAATAVKEIEARGGAIGQTSGQASTGSEAAAGSGSSASADTVARALAVARTIMTDEQWLRDMMWGAQILRPAQQQGFVEGQMPA